jgi:hypothetical protein
MELSTTTKGAARGDSHTGDQVRNEDQPSITKDVEKQAIEDLGEESQDEAIEAVELASSADDDDDDDDNGESGGGGAGGLSRVMSRVLSRTSIKSATPSPPPDGGLAAWTAGRFWFFPSLFLPGTDKNQLLALTSS